MTTKRQKRQRQTVEENEEVPPTTSSGSYREEVKELSALLNKLKDMQSNAEESNTLIDTETLQTVKNETKAVMTKLIAHQKALKLQKKEEASELDAILQAVFAELQGCIIKVGRSCIQMKQTYDNFMGGQIKGKEEWKDFFAYAHKLSFNTFAPANFIPGDSRWGVVGPFVQPVGSSTGFWHFSPPAPQKWHIDASVIYDYSKIEEANDVKGEEGVQKLVTEEESTPQPKVEDREVKEPVKEYQKNTILSHMVDFVLNPDLVADDDGDLQSEDFMSTSSD